MNASAAREIRRLRAFLPICDRLATARRGTERARDSRMDESQLIQGLRARATEDARRFRERFGSEEVPNEKWLDNGFTAALPLVTEAAELPGDEVQPRLFSIYREEVLRNLGVESARPDDEGDRRKSPGQLVEEPTPGEN